MSMQTGRRTYSQAVNSRSLSNKEKPLFEMTLQFNSIIEEGEVKYDVLANPVGRSIAFEKYICAFNSGDKFNLTNKFDKTFELLLREKYGIDPIKRIDSPMYVLKDSQIINLSDFYVITKKIYPIVIVISKVIFKRKEGYTITVQDVKPDRLPKDIDLFKVYDNYIEYPNKEIFSKSPKHTTVTTTSSHFMRRISLLTQLHDNLKRDNSPVVYSDIDIWMANCLGSSLNTNLMFLLNGLTSSDKIIVTKSSVEAIISLFEESSKEYEIQNISMAQSYQRYKEISFAYNVHVPSIVSLFLQIHTLWQSEFPDYVEKHTASNNLSTDLLPFILIKNEYKSFNKFMEAWFVKYDGDISSRKKEIIYFHKVLFDDIKKCGYGIKLSGSIKQEIKLLTGILAEKLDDLSKVLKSEDFCFPEYLWKTLTRKV